MLPIAKDRRARDENRDLIAKQSGIATFMGEMDDRLRELQPWRSNTLTDTDARKLLIATRIELESAQRVLAEIGPLLPIARRLNATAARFPRAAAGARRLIRYLWLRAHRLKRST